MNSILKLLLASFFVFCNANILAQDSATNSIAEKTGDLMPAEALRDTVLSKNEFVSKGSVQNYKQDRDFAYMKYLDSLLRQTKDLSIDTFTVNSSNASKRNKNISQKPEQKNIRPASNIFNQPFVKIIFWALAFVFIGFIIYKLFFGENFFTRNRSYKNISDTPKEENSISDSSAYDRLIAQAAINKNYRLAIRYLYLQTLQKLTSSGLLQFSPDKTNYQYVAELEGKPYQNDFAALTLHYEYVWYGRFDLSEEMYNRLVAGYKSFYLKL